MDVLLINCLKNLPHVKKWNSASTAGAVGSDFQTDTLFIKFSKRWMSHDCGS